MSHQGDPDQDTTVRYRSLVTGVERDTTLEIGMDTTAWTTGDTVTGTTAGTADTQGTLVRQEAGASRTASGLRTGMAGQTGQSDVCKYLPQHSTANDELKAS